MKNQFYEKWRIDALQYLGGKCVVCGTTDKLEFDHINPELKDRSISSTWTSSGLDTEELDKCQLLCYTHHKEKHTPDHGTLGRYTRHKCRCDLCRTVWNAKTQEYKKKAKVAQR